jgi:signal transduction histidine kinase
MTRLRPLALVAGSAALGVALTLAIALLALGADHASHLVVPLSAAAAATVAATAAASGLLGGASLRTRFVAIACFATLTGLVNLVVLAELMIVNKDDAVMVGSLAAYSTAAAVGAAVAVAGSSRAAVSRVSEVARSMARGNLGARVGRVGGGAELDELAVALDEMAERLSASLVRERALEEQRKDLIVAVSHDLRSPLSALKAQTEAIEDGIVDDPATIREYTAGIRRSVDALTALIDDLFEFAQLEAGAIEAEAERAELGEVVEAAIGACGAHATQKGLVLRTSLGDAGHARCSPRLGRVLQNLLQNAIRHTPVDGTVLVEARRTGSEIELAVEDSGEGLDPASLDQVFEPFWRADPSRGPGGSGLGLALAKRIVEALGGSIRVESDPDRGARFAVLIPQP